MPAEHSPHALPAARAWLLPLGSARPLRAELGQALARRTGGGDGGRPAAGLQQPLPEHRRAQRRDSPRVRRGAADLDGYEAPDRPAVEVAPRAGTGFAWTEAPRGMLWHRYEIDEEGTILHAQIVPPTSQLRAGRRAAATALRAGDSQQRPLYLVHPAKRGGAQAPRDQKPGGVVAAPLVSHSDHDPIRRGRADEAIVVDAVSSNAQSGAIHRLDAVSTKLPAELYRGSTHALSVAEAVELARALERLPRPSARAAVSRRRSSRR
jgi:hypothetical protein